MPWAKTILSQFQMVSRNPSRAEFHGPYNKLLYSLFPADTDFTVFPRFVPERDSAPLRRFLYEVHFDERPVFLLELKRPGDLRYSFKRREADQQIRESMEALRGNTVLTAFDSKDECPLPVHAVSAFGTGLCFYKMHHNQPIERIDSPIPASPKRATGTVPQECWALDILEKEGEEKFKSVVEEVKEASLLSEPHQ
ncbi:hypothetical protein EDB89DRAFT_1853036 [Lactarius sanguifluus]|nr:hypothetical protein EDB89DRAFT_1853036 [Lactarius sanguifluus]